MNVELLQKVKEKVLAEPEALDMGTWLDRYPECGTVGCIAGWACALSGHVPETDREVEIRALSLLGLPFEELFYPQDWPPRHQVVLAEHAPRTSGYAAAVAAAIDDYIATGGWEEDLGA